MPEIVWKQGAENDLLEIFGNLDDHQEGSGERFVERLDFTLANLRQHPEIAPIFEPPVRRLVIGRPASVCSTRSNSAASSSTRSCTLRAIQRRSGREFAGS
jgi:plasmid stabilization system protein ParE